jgi:FtsH-binding integral membrane protein
MSTSVIKQPATGGKIAELVFLGIFESILFGLFIGLLVYSYKSFKDVKLGESGGFQLFISLIPLALFIAIIIYMSNEIKKLK